MVQDQNRPAGSGTQESGEILLRNGVRVPVRRLHPDDAARLRNFHEHLSRRSIYYRFFGVMPHLSEAQARRFTQMDYVDRWALVALDPDDPEQFIGVVRFDRGPAEDEGEIAAVVADRYQGRGLGRALLERLVVAARERGLRRLFALVLADNVRMIHLLRQLGYPCREVHADGTEQIVLEITPARPDS